MLEIVAQKPQNGIVLQANQLKEGTLKSLQKSTGQYMGLLCVALCAPNQLQTQTFVVLSAVMKWVGVYLVSVGPNKTEYAAIGSSETNVDNLTMYLNFFFFTV